MSRQRERIRKAVESRGYAVQSLDWEPWSPGGEKEGIGGGWLLELDRDYLPNTTPGNELGGLNADELLADIDYWLRPSDPCPCPDAADGVFGRHPNIPRKGDPEQPLHEPECQWRINYRLSWWGDRS